MNDYGPSDRLLNRHRRLIERLCMQASYGNAAQCADMLQDCYEVLWRRMHTLRNGASLWEERAWVAWQWRSVISHHRRRHRGLLPIDSYLADTIAAPDDSAYGELLEELAAELDRRDRLVLGLMLEGYTTSEIAAELHLAPENAKTVRRRLLARLRQAYDNIINQK